MPAANPRWNPPWSHPYHRHRAIGGNVPVNTATVRWARRIPPANSSPRCTCPSESLSPRLSPKRLFNWSRILFVIRRALLPWKVPRRSFRYGHSLFLAPVSFLSPRRSLPFIPRDSSPMCEACDRELREKERIPWRITVESTVSCSGSYYGWCGSLGFLNPFAFKEAEKFEEPFASAKVVGTAKKKPRSRFPDNECFAIFARS